MTRNRCAAVAPRTGAALPRTSADTAPPLGRRSRPAANNYAAQHWMRGTRAAPAEEQMRRLHSLLVMRGLDPRINGAPRAGGQPWVPGPSPGTTKGGQMRRSCGQGRGNIYVAPGPEEEARRRTNMPRRRRIRETRAPLSPGEQMRRPRPEKRRAEEQMRRAPAQGPRNTRAALRTRGTNMPRNKSAARLGTRVALAACPRMLTATRGAA